MTSHLGYDTPVGGGPVRPGDAYRWNLPVLTYGFDPDFVATFGEAGVKAVEAAIDQLRGLPDLGAADALLLGGFPTQAYRVDFAAQQGRLVDLRSVALGALVQQLGLASPERYVWCLRSLVGEGETSQFHVITRNYSPLTGTPTATINGVSYAYRISAPGAPEPSDAIEMAESFPGRSTAAGFNDFPGDLTPEMPGSYLTGLSRDDVAGLAWLWATNRIAWEELPPDCEVAPGGPPLVRGARRPGVGRIEWRRQEPATSGAGWNPLVLTFTDRYFNPEPATQIVVRTVVSPDIVFRVAKSRYRPLYLLPSPGGVSEPLVGTTDTARWVSRVGENEALQPASGPGQITPGATITFNASPALTWQPLVAQAPPPGPQWMHLPRLGIYDGGPVPPTPLPTAAPKAECLVVLAAYRKGRYEPAGTWVAEARPGETVRIEYSIDLVHWSIGAEVPAEAGSHVVTDLLAGRSAARFYRLRQP